MDSDTALAIGNLGSQIDKGFSDVHKRLDTQNETIHHLDMAVQSTNSNAVLCKAEMGPRVSYLEKHQEKTSNRTWDIVRPIFTEVLKLVLIGLMIYMVKRGGF